MRNKNTTTIRDIDLPHYSFLKAIYLSFFSSKLYIDVAKRWKNLSLKYLLILLMIICIPLSIRLIVDLNQYYDQSLVYPFKAIPNFVIQNGQVKFDKPMPYSIKNEQGKVIVIIDTTGVVNQIDDKNPDLVLLINKDKFSFRNPHLPAFLFEPSKEPTSEIYHHTFGAETNQIFEGGGWAKSSHLKIIKYVLISIVYPTCVAIMFFLYGVIILIAAMLVPVFSSTIFKVITTYRQAFRLLMVSATPHLTFLLLYLTVNHILPGMKLFLVIIWLCYLIFSLVVLKKSSRQMVHR